MILGGLLLTISVGHHVREINVISTRLGPAIALFLDGSLSLGLIYAGYWLRQRNLTPTTEWSVGIWTILGCLVGATIAGMTIVVQVVEGRPLVEPQFRLLVSGGGGALVLFTAGYYAARQQTLNHRYETLFNNTIQITGLLRLDGSIIEINDTALEFGDLERDTVVDKPFDEISWWTHSEEVQENIQDAIAQAKEGGFVRYETEARGADGLRTIEISAKPVTNANGDVIQLIVAGYDITDKQRQREHLRVLHRLMRHNMRNDLMKVNGWTQMAATAASHEERMSHANRVKNILDSWEKMTNELKEVQKLIELKSEQPDHKITSDLLTDIVKSQQSKHPGAEISLTLDTPFAGRIPGYIKKAIIEAIDNAVAASTEETPSVDVTVSNTDNNWIRITIADDGPGIPPAEAAVLETGKESALMHGSALGIWKIRMAIKQAGGDISVDDLNSGTAIQFQVPSRGGQRHSLASV
ncbi:ATP-binding protein [Halorubrum sp. RMP-47]|uniref:histidine kinase n=1 Tax=Halorubrum miltondacostae TaxID=3076378 RepID=A0ABD5M3Y3_9EURY